LVEGSSPPGPLRCLFTIVGVILTAYFGIHAEPVAAILGLVSFFRIDR
jgi:hypothetical protein